MKVTQVDERSIGRRREAVFILFLFERPPGTAKGSDTRETDVYLFHDATLGDVMSWLGERLGDGDLLWALGVKSEATDMIWVHGGDYHIEEGSRTALEQRRAVEMETTGARILSPRRLRGGAV